MAKIRSWDVLFAATTFAAVASSPGTRADACFITVNRPTQDPAPWSAECGGSKPVPPFIHTPKVSGKSINLLDAIRDCSPKSRANPCVERIGIEVVIDKANQLDPSVPEGDSTPPSCFPQGASREWIKLGHANFHRSCFRGLSDQDWEKVRDWGKQPWPYDFKQSLSCKIDEFGVPGVDENGMPFETAHDGQDKWSQRFRRDYPSAAALSNPKYRRHLASPNAASAIYKSFKKALKATDTCLETLNPDLADRMRKAMGVETRSENNRAVVYRPTIRCEQQLPLECKGFDAEQCSKIEKSLSASALDSGGGSGIAIPPGCQPADGALLASINSKNLKHGDLLDGSAEISIYNATALSGQGTRVAASLFHEFLHAAGAHKAADHNEGVHEGKLLPGDQVYACQALAFTDLFENLSAVDLKIACHACAKKEAGYQALCERGSDFLKRKLGCRVSR